MRGPGPYRSCALGGAAKVHWFPDSVSTAVCPSTVIGLSRVSGDADFRLNSSESRTPEDLSFRFSFVRTDRTAVRLSGGRRSPVEFLLLRNGPDHLRHLARQRGQPRIVGSAPKRPADGRDRRGNEQPSEVALPNFRDPDTRACPSAPRDSPATPSYPCETFVGQPSTLGLNDSCPCR